jgi:hypothetical protein
MHSRLVWLLVMRSMVKGEWSVMCCQNNTVLCMLCMQIMLADAQAGMGKMHPVSVRPSDAAGVSVPVSLVA